MSNREYLDIILIILDFASIFMNINDSDIYI